MLQIVARVACVVGACITVLAFAATPAPAYFKTFDLQDSNCWQEGQLGSEAWTCANPGATFFLADHMIDDDNAVEDYRQPEPGQYCSYFGIADTLDDWEPEGLFHAPSGDQRGDEHGSVCASWNSSPEPTFWGVQVRNGEAIEEALKCDAPGVPAQRCGMQHYVALADEDTINHPETLTDRPWASYYVHPVLELYSATNPREVETGPSHGNSWGYLCPVLEDRTTGNILEVCFEEWLSPVGASYEWNEQHVAECRSASAEFGHAVDKLVVPEPDKKLVNGFGEAMEFFPLEGEPEEEVAGVSADVSGSRLEGLVNLDDTSYTEKKSGGRTKEPELGYGCGRGSSANPSEWALIGVSNGIEAWESGQIASRLDGSVLDTTFEPHAIEVTAAHAKEITETQATVSGEIDPYGFETDYVVEYSKEYMTPEGRYTHTTEASAGTGLIPAPVSTTLTGLSPHTTYYYRIRAFHPTPGIGSEVAGEEHIFTTGPVSIKGQGSTLQELAQQNIFMPGFDAKAHTEVGEVSEYQGTGSAGMAAWGLFSRSEAHFSAWQYVGTDQPPSPSQRKSMEEAAGGATLLTIPTLQAAVAIVIHLPKGCTAATSDNKKSSGRLVLDNLTLERIFRGTITKWSEITDDGDALTCETEAERESPITRVVSSEGSGTAAILKKYLYEVSEGEEVDGTATWETLAEEGVNTRWPHEETDLVRGKGENGIIAKVAGTYGAIGYANLANAYASTCFRGASCETEIVSEKVKATVTGGEGGEAFWAFVQNNGISTGKPKYEDPEKAGKDGKEGTANCKDDEYINLASVRFPPTTEEAWNEVSTTAKEKDYSLCALSYDLSLNGFRLVPALIQPDEQEVALVKEYVTYMVEDGAKLLGDETDYESLPTNSDPEASVLESAKRGAAKIGE